MRLRDIIFLVLEGQGLTKTGFNVEATGGPASTGGYSVGDASVDLEVEIFGDYDRQLLFLELYETIVHEITHLGQVLPDNVKQLCGLEYFACQSETEAFVAGLMARAIHADRSVEDIFVEYLQSQVKHGLLSVGDLTPVKKRWLAWVDELDDAVEEQKRLYAKDTADQIIQAIQKGKKKGSISLAGYEHLADDYDPEFFTVEFGITYPPN